VSAVIEKTRERRKGVYFPHLYIVKEDGEPALRLWALSCLIQDRADALPGYQQFVQQLRDKVRRFSSGCNWLTDVYIAAGQRVLDVFGMDMYMQNRDCVRLATDWNSRARELVFTRSVCCSHCLEALSCSCVFPSRNWGP
jgi:hypothetical protein